MKKTVLLFMMSLAFAVGYAADMDRDRNEPRDSKVIAAQIYDMLAENAIPNDIRGARAEVRVAVDTGNYLRILSVETDNDAFEAFIRSKVDFQKLTKGTFEKGIVYRVPIEVRK